MKFSRPVRLKEIYFKTATTVSTVPTKKATAVLTQKATVSTKSTEHVYFNRTSHHCLYV